MSFNPVKQLQSSFSQWLYDRFVQLIIYPSIWVAAAIASLGIYVQQVLELGHNWQAIALLFFVAVIPYNLDRIFDSYVQKIPDLKEQVFFRQYYVWILLTIAIAATALLLYNAPIQVRYLSIAGIVPLLYGTPLFPLLNQSKWQWYRLKDIPGSKAWIVGSTITYAVISLPLAYDGTQFDLVAALTTLFLFVFIVTNSHIFDIRDIESDREKGVITLPIMSGIKGTKQILTVMNLLMLLILVIAWITKVANYNSAVIVATAVNLIYIDRVSIETPRWVYSILIEGFLFVPILVNAIAKTILS